MKPPHTPRSARDLPKRVPGSTRSIGRGAGPAQDGDPAGNRQPTAPDGGDPIPDAAGQGARPPRLTQFSSLGSRSNAGRGPTAPTPVAGAPADGSAGERFDEDFARHRGARRTPAPDIVVPPAPAGRRPKDKTRREGSRGALVVVGVVGLLAAGSVLLTLGLINGDQGAERDRASVTVAPDLHSSDVLDGLTAPSASAAGKQADGSQKPAPSASPTRSASGTLSASPGAHVSASAKATTKAGTTAQAAVPGTGVFSHASHRCIDVVGGKGVPGTGLVISDCSQSASQHWTFTGGTMRSLGMCVQLAGGSTADGTDLVLATCDGGAAQRFVLNFRHDLVSGLANKCADVRDQQTTNGTRLQLWSCAGSPNQKWSTD
ncbi:RICIN domain-containing protein [Streptomyces atratus]|uniref:RICIN domain-containing protein n=1 Tax=Streptomyces atratus TaxID=1893 RepID=UPI0016700FAA|nr:RICIN domain-containing protein [Streptomyces atratus]